MSEGPRKADAEGMDPDRQRYVRDVHARLDVLTFYELLGVTRGADPQTVKRAYFKLVRIVHPDRYFGRDLGELRGMLEQVFARMTQAYETLTSNARAVYDASLPDETRSAPAKSAPAAAPAAPVDPAVVARKKAAMEAIGARLAAGRAKVEQLGAEASRALAAGDVAAAAEKYRQALLLAPNDAALRSRHDEAHRVIAMRTRDAYRRQAELEERHGNWTHAAAAWQRVVDADPRDTEAAARLVAARARIPR